MNETEKLIAQIVITVITFIGAFFIATYNNRRKDKFTSQEKRIHALNECFMLLRSSHLNLTNTKFKYENLKTSNPIERVIEIPYLDFQTFKKLEFNLSKLTFIVSERYKKLSFLNRLKIKAISFLMLNYKFQLNPITNETNSLDRIYCYIENYNYFIHTLNKRNKLRLFFDNKLMTNDSIYQSVSLEIMEEKLGTQFINDIMMRTEHLIQLVDFLIHESSELMATYKELFGGFIDEAIRKKLEEPFLFGQYSEKWGKGIYIETCEVDYNKLMLITGLDIDTLKQHYQIKF